MPNSQGAFITPKVGGSIPPPATTLLLAFQQFTKQRLIAVNAAECHFAEILPRISEVAGCNGPLLPSLVPFPRVKRECNRRSYWWNCGREYPDVHAREFPSPPPAKTMCVEGHGR